MKHLVKTPIIRLIWLVLLAIAPIIAPAIATAEQSEPYESFALSARLISAQNTIEPEQTTLSVALKVDLQEGWKTYWRTPGQAGLAPVIYWHGSENLADVEFQWPAPERFRAFDIENYGYSHSVTFPLHVSLAEAGAPTSLHAQVELLVCSDVCIPEIFNLRLDFNKSIAMDTVGNNGSIDAESALYIAEAAARVPPLNDETEIRLAAVNFDADNYRYIAEFLSEEPMQNPDVFAELGSSTFDPPSLVFSNDRKRLVAVFPQLKEDGEPNDLRLTLVDNIISASFDAGVKITPTLITGNGINLTTILWMSLFALLGGLILNIMPCVLPVLSIKLASALSAQDKSLPRIRISFIACALGVMAFMWLLAVGLIGLKTLGYSIGWGIQFQNPYFLAFLILVILGFSANLFGLFHINLPHTLNTQMANNKTRGLAGDFATGMFAALLATPCSAPFLGTAVAFALSGSALDIMVIFTALGAGLAMPYIVIAIVPSVIKALPKPGPWMVWVKYILGGFLLLTALWLGSVLMAVHSLYAALGVFALCALGLGQILYNRRGWALGFAPLIVAVMLPAFLSVDGVAPRGQAAAGALDWQEFAYEDIAPLVADGQVVFVDVTADWCLSCQANKRLVLNKTEVKAALQQSGVSILKADWTRPDADILAYLQTHGRAGIPFNIVYGKGAPRGIVLSEILTPEAVLEALAKAR